MKIRQLQLKNIGVFDDETIEFQPCSEGKAEIHILTGENGSGKSTVLITLANFFDLDFSHNTLSYLDGDDEAILISSNLFKNNLNKRFRNNENAEINFCIQFQNEFDEYKFKYKTSSNGYTSYPIKIYPKKVIDDAVLTYTKNLKSKNGFFENKFIDKLKFAAFAYSGYRRIQDEKIEIGKEIDVNPLFQSLDFIKSEIPNFTINQWLGQNLTNRALSKEKNKVDEANQFEKIIKDLEKIIVEVIGYQIKFEMQSAIKLVVIKDGQEFDFDVLPDGLKSLISWIADLLMRLSLLDWEDDIPIFDREIILFLDEIEVHLHPAWQRKVLPVVQKLFKNSQIFVSTHSPFVVNSVDDAWVYKLKLDNGKAKVESVERSEDAQSYRYVLRNTFDIDNEFGVEIEKRLDEFYRERDTFLAGNGNSKKAKTELKKIAKELAKQSRELKSKIDFELFQLSEITGEDF